jgi:DNA-binding response OmpR family regulator
MWNEPENQACEIIVVDDVLERKRRARRIFITDETVVDPWSYPARRGLGVIRLAPVEYRIFKFLSDRPNLAFTPRRIAAAISTGTQMVTAESLSDHVRSLRARLGFFSDYIQAVPYIGYRFKAA